MRICVDLDGVIAQLKQPGQTYADVPVVDGARERLASLRAAGHTIIIFTARHMKTCGGNAALAVARIGTQTLNWLAQHDIPYDEIQFGKPWADIYIDDNALRFQRWADVAPDGANLPRSVESTHGAHAAHQPGAPA